MPLPRFQFGDYIRTAAEITPELPCFIFEDGRERSFKEANTRVNLLATGLLRKGIIKGDRVAILSIDHANYIETMFACTKIGAIFVPLNNRLQLPELIAQLTVAEPTALLYSERYEDLAGKLLQAISSIKFSIAFDQSKKNVQYNDFLLSGEDHEPEIDIFNEDIMALAFTSGTTGVSKGVLQPYGMLKIQCSHGMTNYEIDWEGRRYSGSPMFHIGGYGLILTNIISRSASLILPQFNATEALRCIDELKITDCLFVPTMISSLLDHPNCGNTSFSSLKTIMYGGAPMSPALLKRAIETFGCNFVQLFGGTETGTQSTLTSKDHWRAHAGEHNLLTSVGRPGIGVVAQIVDSEGKEVPRGTIGDIVTLSDQRMAGYLGMPDATAQAFRGGWYWGGDMGYMDEDGYIFLAGRSKDMIIRGGENVYPVEIETVLTKFPGVTHAAVIGEPDDHWGEVVIACISVSSEFAGIPDLMAHCSQNLASYKRPIRIEILDFFPLNSSGKIFKPRLRELNEDARREEFSPSLSSASAIVD